MSDIFDFHDRDLVNLQKWYKRKPKQFVGAARNMLNKTAERVKIQSIRNIEAKTTTRSRPFVKNSIRFTRAKGTSLNKLESQTFSFDISGKGRSSGFEELEVGKKSKSSRVPTLASRGGGSGKESSKVARGVRMDKQSGMLQPRHFKKFSKTYRGRVGSMLRITKKRGDKTPMIIPRRVSRGPMSRMKPGIWKQKSAKNLSLMNPFDGDRARTKRIAWMAKAIKTVTSRSELKKMWETEINRIMKGKVR